MRDHNCLIYANICIRAYENNMYAHDFHIRSMHLDIIEVLFIH